MWVILSHLAITYKPAVAEDSNQLFTQPPPPFLPLQPISNCLLTFSLFSIFFLFLSGALLYYVGHFHQLYLEDWQQGTSVVKCLEVFENLDMFSIVFPLHFVISTFIFLTNWIVRVYKPFLHVPNVSRFFWAAFSDYLYFFSLHTFEFIMLRVFSEFIYLWFSRFLWTVLPYGKVNVCWCADISCMFYAWIFLSCHNFPLPVIYTFPGVTRQTDRHIQRSHESQHIH